jgi:hypothetical protein
VVIRFGHDWDETCMQVLVAWLILFTFFGGSVCASSPFALIPVKKSASGGSNFAAMAFDGAVVSCPHYGKILIEPGS